jgi:hypothetical protein
VFKAEQAFRWPAGAASLLHEANPRKKFSAIFKRGRIKSLVRIAGGQCGFRAAQRICFSSRLISFMSNAPTLCFAR